MDISWSEGVDDIYKIDGSFCGLELHVETKVMGEYLVSSSHNCMDTGAVHSAKKHWKMNNFKGENDGFGHECEFSIF